MAIPFSLVAKLMSGSLSSDDIAELLSSMGLDADAAAVAPGQVKTAFAKLWESGQEAGAVVLRVELRKENGDKVSGLLVFSNGDPLACGEALALKAEKLLLLSA
jgi:hypothetical protein